MVINNEIPFLLGVRFGELSQFVELVIDSSKNRDQEKKTKIKVLFVFESLKYILEELTKLDITDDLLEDITSYLDLLTKNYEDIKRKIEKEDTTEEKQMIVSKIVKKLSIHKRFRNQDLKLEDVNNLAVRLKIWKDRVTIGFAKKL
ncbi:MAG: hypothetical protein ACXADY_13105 [Candidatus Hodarchaeales archaeon]|jgi:hypothetical protein